MELEELIQRIERWKSRAAAAKAGVATGEPAEAVAVEPEAEAVAVEEDTVTEAVEPMANGEETSEVSMDEVEEVKD